MRKSKIVLLAALGAAVVLMVALALYVRLALGSLSSALGI